VSLISAADPALERGRKGYCGRMSSRESHFKSPGTTKTGKAGDAIDVAARYFQYKFYEATEGQPGQWRALYGMGESAETRAVEREWVTLDVNRKPLERRAALTDEGRRLARRGRPESKLEGHCPAIIPIPLLQFRGRKRR
jgi:hypothetical protein